MGKRKRHKRDRAAATALAPPRRAALEHDEDGQEPDRLADSPGGQVRQGELFPAAISFERTRRFTGPLPPPDLLREFDQVLPGLAERIVRIAEKEGDHRRAAEWALIRLSGWGLASALVVCLVSVVGGIALLWQGRTLTGLAPLVLALGGVIATLLLRRDAGVPADLADEDVDEE